MLSALFYASQVTAFILDSTAATWLRRRARREGRLGAGMPGNSRIWVCLAVVIAVAFFLFMFTTKDDGLFDNRMLVQQVYVTSEYLLATLCLGYAVAGYFDTKPCFDELRATD